MKRQGDVIYACLELTRESADTLASKLRVTTLSDGTQPRVRVHPRTVRANSVDLPVWAVIARRKAAQS